METPDPPNDTPGALKQVVLTPHDILWSLRVTTHFKTNDSFIFLLVFVARLRALIATLPETKLNSPWKWMEDEISFLWDTILSGAMLAFFGGYVAFKQFPRRPKSSKYLVRIGALEPLKSLLRRSVCLLKRCLDL